VGSAAGHNPIALLIPCHRVLRSAGDISGYRWGSLRKQAILARESAQSEGQAGVWRV
jgi:AraC family transcriptional regulator of adaptative response/methylated-DNA-[protein]-cysteine methyltransferase